MPQGEAALARGKSAMKAKNYTLAHEEYKKAVGYLPDSVVSGRAHDEAVDGYCKTGVILAQARIAQGDYAGAEAILNEILSNRYNPNCREAQELYKHLRTPGYFNRTITPTFINKVEEVKQLLTDADGFYQSGQYDLAMKRYDQVLALDPYNTAARKGQEKIDNTKYQYGEEAYDETRARQLWKVEGAWQQPVRKYGVAGAPVSIGAPRDLGGTALVNKKLSSIIIPHIEFRDATDSRSNRCSSGTSSRERHRAGRPEGREHRAAPCPNRTNCSSVNAGRSRLRRRTDTGAPSVVARLRPRWEARRSRRSWRSAGCRTRYRGRQVRALL